MVIPDNDPVDGNSSSLKHSFLPNFNAVDHLRRFLCIHSPCNIISFYIIAVKISVTKFSFKISTHDCKLSL